MEEREQLWAQQVKLYLHIGRLTSIYSSTSGTVPLSSGPSVIVVGADGNWTLLAG